MADARQLAMVYAKLLIHAQHILTEFCNAAMYSGGIIFPRPHPTLWRGRHSDDSIHRHFFLINQLVLTLLDVQHILVTSTPIPDANIRASRSSRDLCRLLSNQDKNNTNERPTEEGSLFAGAWYFDSNDSDNDANDGYSAPQNARSATQKISLNNMNSQCQHQLHPLNSYRNLPLQQPHSRLVNSPQSTQRGPWSDSPPSY
eukprot:scaffold427411_cov35-Prasinocladus_malaysianus.AAC.1